MHHVSNVQIEDPVISCLDSQNVSYVQLIGLILLDMFQVLGALVSETSRSVFRLYGGEGAFRQSLDQFNPLRLIKLCITLESLDPVQKLSQHWLRPLNDRFEYFGVLLNIKCFLR